MSDSTEDDDCDSDEELAAEDESGISATGIVISPAVMSDSAEDDDCDSDEDDDSAEEEVPAESESSDFVPVSQAATENAAARPSAPARAERMGKGHLAASLTFSFLMFIIYLPKETWYYHLFE